MSNTDGFESIVSAAMEKVRSNNELAAIEVAAILGMLAGAHEREMAELRKTYEREMGRYE